MLLARGLARRLHQGVVLPGQSSPYANDSLRGRLDWHLPDDAASYAA